MNIIRPYNILLMLAASLLIGVSLASCSQEELGYNEPGSSDKYLLRFTATVEGMNARSDGKTAWNDGDVIGVKVGDYAYPGRYRLNADGTINEALEAASWLNENPGRVIGWYPLEPQTDVEISDQTQGFDDIDFLTAIEENQTYRSMVRLSFRHQMTKVSCKLVAGEGITNADLQTARVSLAGCTSVSFNEGVMTGSGDGWIATTADHEALLVPRQITGRPFIKIEITLTVNGNKIPKTLTYTPRSDDANLKGGEHHTYTITVNKDRLEVQTISGAWTESKEDTELLTDMYRINLTSEISEMDLEFSSNVTPETGESGDGGVKSYTVFGNTFTISRTPDADNCHLGLVFADNNPENKMERLVINGKYVYYYTLGSPIEEAVNLKLGEHVEPGDFYFDDGKWGRIPKELYEGERTPIGMVFAVGAGRHDDPSDFDIMDEEGNYIQHVPVIHGYVLALKDASPASYWAGTNKRLVSSESNGKYSGFKSTFELKNSDLYKKTTTITGMYGLPACKAVIEYRENNPTPSTSSGWYYPSHYQLEDLYSFMMHPLRRVCLIEAGGDALAEGWQRKSHYWSCTEGGITSAWMHSYQYSDRDYDYSKDAQTKQNKAHVRCVLTF